MNRRNFITRAATAAIAAIFVPFQKPDVKPEEFSGDVFPAPWPTLNLWVPSGLNPSEWRRLRMLLVSRNVQPHMRCQFRFTKNPILLTHLEQIA